MKFSCNGCGGCCHGPIALTHSEAINSHYLDFPLMIAFSVTDVRNIPIEKDRGSYAKAMRSYHQKAMSFYIKSSDGRKVAVHPQILTLSPVDEPCNRLDYNGRCQIYNRKPSVCSLYPVRIDTPLSRIDDGLKREKGISNMKVAHIPCEGWEVSNDDPLEDLKSPEKFEIFNSRYNDQVITRARLKQFFSDMCKLPEVVKKIDIYSELNGHGDRLVNFPFSQYVDWLNSQGLLMDIEVVSLHENQKLHLEGLLEKVEARSEEKAMTGFKTVVLEHLRYYVK